MPDRPEPNGWELLEGLKRIERRLDDMAKGFVTAEVFAIFQRQNASERDEDRKDIDANRKAIEEVRSSQAEAEKEKAKNRLSIALAVTAIVASILTPFIQRAMGG